MKTTNTLFLKAFLFLFTLINLFCLSSVKAGGIKGEYFLSHHNKDTTWDIDTYGTDSITINAGDTLIFGCIFSCNGDCPPYLTCVWYKDTMPLKTDTFLASSGGWGSGRDSIIITEGGVYKIELPIFSRTFSVAVFENALGIPNPLVSNPTINIYPNPANEELFIQLNVPASTQVSYSIYNYLGEAIKSGEIYLDKNAGNELDISKLNSGIYFMKVRYNNNEQMSRFVKS